jgi:hypothetical protein
MKAWGILISSGTSSADSEGSGMFLNFSWMVVVQYYNATSHIFRKIVAVFSQIIFWQYSECLPKQRHKSFFNIGRIASLLG